MAVYYKFKSAKDYDSILIEGQFISVGNLKERIFESNHLGRGTDFDLMISNAQTNEEYVDEATMIPKNTSVLIRRVPGRPRKPIVTQPDEPKTVEDKAEELPLQSSMLVGDSSATMNNLEESELDVFGNDLYAPEVVPTQLGNAGVDVSSASRIDEDDKLKALIETPALDWGCQVQDGFGGRGFGRGMMAGRGFGRGGFERKTPPPRYICHRCKVPGHFIQHCPTNGEPKYDIRMVKPPTGIPKSMLMATPDGSYVLPSGAVAVLKPNEAAFEKEIEGMPSTRLVNDLPPELRCPLCKEVMKDAVLTSKCCFRSFCDKCIRDYIISKSMCVCGATNTLADDLLPNKTLRETISRILESTTSSTENVGSLVQVQDMESARHVPPPPKVPSPALSGALKGEPRQTSPIQHSSDVKVANVKEVDAASKGNAVNAMAHSLEKKTLKRTDQSELTPESMSTKEPKSPESAPVPEEGQEKLLGVEQGKKKKKKKAHLPGSGTDMQWSGFQELGPENYVGMPCGPSVYNHFWGGAMPMGFDGFMAPFGGAMPYNMGYTPGPFDVPFGGMLPPDPFAAQGYIMPPLPPRDLSELGFNSMNMNKVARMSREEFEARKADIRRKREFERLNGRERSRNGRGVGGKEVSSSGADVSPMKSKPMLISRAERHGRSERASESIRQPSPPPTRLPAKRRSTDNEVEREIRREEKKKASAAAAAEQDRKHKASVFSRISFPSESSEKESKKKRTDSSSSDTAAAAATNGAINKDHHHRCRERDERKRSSAYEQHHESSEEEEDEDYHFKRRPSRRERREDHEERPSSRVSRERRR